MLNLAVLAVAIVSGGYTVVLHDGSALVVRERPADGPGLVVASLEDGTLVSLPAERIDWATTEIANRPVVKRQAPALAPRKRARAGATITNKTIRDFAEANPSSDGVPPTGGRSAVSSVAEYAGPQGSVFPPVEQDQQGRGPDYWLSRSDAIRDELRVAEAALASALRSLQDEEDTLLHGVALRSRDGVRVVQHSATADGSGAAYYRLSQLREKVRDAEAGFQIARRRLADLETEARQAGVPPGWLRR